MTNRLFKHVLFIAMLFFSIQNAYGALIIDTGVPTITNVSLAVYNNTNGHNWLAGEFILDKDYAITDVQGFLRTYQAGVLTYRICADGGDVPGNAIRTAEKTFSAATALNWHGPSGLSWNLPAGTYWLAFEVPVQGDFDGSMPYYVTPNPLLNYAYDYDSIYSSTSGWTGNDAAKIGVRIYGSPVPLPGAAWLLGSGLAGLVGLGRRRRKK